MPNRKAIERGLDFEAEGSELLGLRQVPGSGNQWHRRGDGEGRGLRASFKSNPTTKRSWSQTRSELREAVEMAAGTGDTPLLVLEDDDGSQFVVARLADFATLLGGGTAPRPRKRGEAMRRAAEIPAMLRDSA